MKEQNEVNAVHDFVEQQRDQARQQIARLPLTMRPSLNEQIARWSLLFPYEQQRTARFIAGLDATPAAQLDALTASLRALEVRMGVSAWHFDAERETMFNASLLARSSEYPAWRHEVQRISAALESEALHAAQDAHRPSRLLLLVLPAALPVQDMAHWKQWSARDRHCKIEGSAEELSAGLASLALQPASNEAVATRWLLDGYSEPWSLPAAASIGLQRLEFARLKNFREWFLDEANKVPKSIEQSDEHLAALRRGEWPRHWPAECVADERLRNFTVELFLSGNGAMVFPSPFTQWAVSEAQRRARPHVMVARFGMRARPKPFTGVAILENPDRISRLPEVDDPQGSAEDALILARYAWLAAARYPEAEGTLCICVAEREGALCMIAPQGRLLPWGEGDRISAADLQRFLQDYLHS